MVRVLRHLLGAGVATALALSLPAAALAAPPSKKHHGQPSLPPATQVYVEQVPTATGGQSVGSTSTGGGNSSVPLSNTAQRALQSSGGKDKSTLKALATDPSLGARDNLVGAPVFAVKAPSALGAAFDLGSGPTALLVLLVVSAGLLALGGSLHFLRRR